MNLDDRIAALSEISYYVTQQNGTERPFTGVLNKEYRPGDYYCIVCDTKLFTDQMKFDSGCGWPAFHTEHNDAAISRIIDTSHGMTRVEVRCGTCDAHLGHVFTDGPAPTGLRYCINSAALRFVASKARHALSRLVRTHIQIEDILLFIDNNLELSKKLNVKRMPTTILINDELFELSRVEGYIDWLDKNILRDFFVHFYFYCYLEKVFLKKEK